MVVTAPFSHPRLNAFPLILKRDRVHSSRNKLVLLYKPETPYLIRLHFVFSLPIAFTFWKIQKKTPFKVLFVKKRRNLAVTDASKRYTIFIFIFSCKELNQQGFGIQTKYPVFGINPGYTVESI